MGYTTDAFAVGVSNGEPRTANREL